MARTGGRVSFRKLRVTVPAAFPAASEWFTVMLILPSEAAEKSRLVDQAPDVQTAVALAAPVITTFRRFAPQVPETEKALTWLRLIRLPAAGELMVRVGAVVSLMKERLVLLDVFPAESLLVLTVMAKVPDGTEDRFMLRLQVDPEQVVVTLPAELARVMVCPLSEQLPDTAKLEVLEEVT